MISRNKTMNHVSAYARLEKTVENNIIILILFHGGASVMRHARLIVMVLILSVLVCVSSSSTAEFRFSDDRFRYSFTTENLDAVIEEYELFDGWYWTTKGDVQQDFHGHPESPGWTSAVEKAKKKDYLNGWFGCRWPIDHVRKSSPDRGGYAECFAFAQFIGYLLSGELNPQGNWDFYYGLSASGGLRVGDILRVEHKYKKHLYEHSAVVYSVNGNEVLFLQVSGSSYNRISVGKGFSDGYYMNLTDMDDLMNMTGMVKICRYNKAE